MNDVPGMVHLRSTGSVPETLTRLETLLAEKGIPIVCRISHSDAAAKAGLSMRPTELLIFGNPKVGTPLMLVSPTLAIDLPLKALVWEDTDGMVWLSYNSTSYLLERHGVTGERGGLAAAEQLMHKAAQGDHEPDPRSA